MVRGGDNAKGEVVKQNTLNPSERGRARVEGEGGPEGSDTRKKAELRDRQAWTAKLLKHVKVKPGYKRNQN